MADPTDVTNIDIIAYGDDGYSTLWRLWNANCRCEAVSKWNWFWIAVIDGDRNYPVRFIKDTHKSKTLRKNRYGPDPTISPDTAYVFQKDDLQ